MMHPQFIFIFNSLLTGILVIAALSLRPAKHFRTPMIGLLLTHWLHHLLLTSRILGVKNQFSLLVGLSFPVKILAAFFLVWFFQLFTQSSQTPHKTPRFFPIVGALSTVWYIAIHLWFPIERLEFGLANIPINYITQFFLVVVGVVTLKFCFKYIAQFEALAGNSFSDIKKLRLPILKGFLIYYFLLFVLSIFDFATGPSIPLYTLKPLFFSVGISGFLIFTLNKSLLFSVEFPKPSASKLDPETSKRVATKILRAMAEDQLYLNADLRLLDLAEAIDEKPYLITTYLNEKEGDTFNKYINKWRIEHSKSMLSNSDFEHLNIMGIALDSGFNSKSVFNEFFKKQVGTTPSQYRNAETSPDSAKDVRI